MLDRIKIHLDRLRMDEEIADYEIQVFPYKIQVSYSSYKSYPHDKLRKDLFGEAGYVDTQLGFVWYVCLDTGDLGKYDEVGE